MLEAGEKQLNLTEGEKLHKFILRTVLFTDISQNSYMQLV